MQSEEFGKIQLKQSLEKKEFRTIERTTVKTNEKCCMKDVEREQLVVTNQQCMNNELSNHLGLLINHTNKK